ncbi:PAS domain-containing sensor histidine kinase [Deinococcus misasensis]|uniref:PAS domain-containing sensor histidine kinase n=1 Tax=Deinococcus misasensis TaxID=392413 RepID=UPI00068D29AA|nr:PAS domain-containing sensor histidine kinase [Deinococcus misasensis]
MSPTRIYPLSLLIGVLLWVGVVLLWGQQRYAELRVGFDTEARILHRVLSQRAEQNEALLNSLAISAEMGLSENQLRAFVASLTSSYPQIAGVEVCQNACKWVLEKNPMADYAIAQKLASGGKIQLWIDPSKLLRSGEGMSRAAFTLQGDGKNLLRGHGQDPVSEFPELHVQKILGSESQPFVLEVRQSVLFRDFPIWQMLGLGVLMVLLAHGAGSGVQSVWRARESTRRAELALQQEKDRAQVVLNAVDDALITFNRENTIQYINPAAMQLLGTPSSGQKVPEVVEFQQGPSLPEVLQGFWQQEKDQDLPDGVWLKGRPIEGSLSMLPDRSGAVLVLRDLGPFRQRMLSRLEESERKRKEHEALLTHVMRVNTTGEVASGMAHELNQPLTAILSQSQGALRVLEEGDTDLAKTALQRTVLQARRAGEIIQRLRAHLVRQPLKSSRVNLSDLVSRLSGLLEADLQTRNLQLSVHLSGLPDVEADSIQLEQVLHNLIRNSMEAMQERPLSDRRIEIAGSVESGQVLLTVRDHGPGLSESALEHLFLPFHSTKKEGMGVGLSLSRTLMQSMNGELFGANHPEEGAVFTLHLQVFQEETHVH